MRLVYFFALSMALHTAALVYPVPFVERRNAAEIIRVTIAPITKNIESGQDRGGTPRPRHAVSKIRARTKVAPKPTVEPQPVPLPDQPRLPSETIEKITNTSDVALVSSIASAEDNRNVMPIFASIGYSAVGGSGTGAHDFGSGGTDSGSGGGSSRGADSPVNGVGLTQARYRNAPRPEYPEAARREGREGRVLLRVLVDDQGRSQKVEINRSSGSDALDRAAVDAIKRWRFYPARYGDRAIDSWIKIPVEFALADANVK